MSTTTGLLLSFIGQEGKSNEDAVYDIFIINNTTTKVICNYNFMLLEKVTFSNNLQLAPQSSSKIGTLKFDELNDSPKLKTESWRVTTEGYDLPFKKELKIKAKQFFKSFKVVPVLNTNGHLFTLHDSLVGSKTISLKEEMKSKGKSSFQYKDDEASTEKWSVNVNKVANFRAEIDLHIDKIAPKGTVPKNEMLSFQIKKCKSFIYDAIESGADSVFIIHGIGKGRLKQAVHELLDEHPFVIDYKNEYHAKYGFGATEVYF